MNFRRAAHPGPVRSLVTILLIVCVSMCCCNVRFLMQGAQVEHAAVGSAGVTPSCCLHCVPTDAPKSSDSQQDEPQQPTQNSSCSCCLKWNDAGGSLHVPPLLSSWLPQTLVTDVAPAPQRAAIAAIAAIGRASALRCDGQTLVRLHCALII